MNPETETFLKLYTSRRSYYHLKNELPQGVAINDISHIVHSVIKHTPTSHNSQGNRAAILTGESHRKLWDHVIKSVSEEFREKPTRMRGAYGTIVFFTDKETEKKLQQEHPRWTTYFKNFEHEASGSAQTAVWVALESLGLGAALQHYPHCLPDALPESIPNEWEYIGVLVFGVPEAPPHKKQFIDNPIRVYQ